MVRPRQRMLSALRRDRLSGRFLHKEPTRKVWLYISGYIEIDIWPVLTIVAGETTQLDIPTIARSNRTPPPPRHKGSIDDERFCNLPDLHTGSQRACICDA